MPTSNAKKQGILQQDWTLQVDLDKKLQFPDIVQTSLRPDIVIQSTATKRIVIVELTVHWEERCQSAYELKKASTPTYKLCVKSVDGKLGCFQ